MPSAASLFRRLYASLKDLWRAALRERATPQGVASSIAVGVFVGCTPFIGLHAGIAALAATLLRLNRLWAIIGSRVSFFLILPVIAFCEVQIAHRIRTGDWASLSVQNALDHAADFFLDWCLGTIPVGTVLALGLGLVAYALAKRYAPIDATLATRMSLQTSSITPRTPAPVPPPSSGSPR